MGALLSDRRRACIANVLHTTRARPCSLQDAIGEGGHARLYRIRDDHEHMFAMKVSQLIDEGHNQRETTAVSGCHA